MNEYSYLCLKLFWVGIVSIYTEEGSKGRTRDPPSDERRRNECRPIATCDFDLRLLEPLLVKLPHNPPTNHPLLLTSFRMAFVKVTAPDVSDSIGKYFRSSLVLIFRVLPLKWVVRRNSVGSASLGVSAIHVDPNHFPHQWGPAVVMKKNRNDN